MAGTQDASGTLGMGILGERVYPGRLVAEATQPEVEGIGGAALLRRGVACIHRPMRTPLLLVPLLLLALPWNSCTRGKARLSDNGPSQLRNGAGFFNPQTETKPASYTNRAFDSEGR